MKSIKFKEENMTLTGVGAEPLPVFFNGFENISCWYLNIIERIFILFTGRIWSHIKSSEGFQSPMYLGVNYPFKKNEKK